MAETTGVKKAMAHHASHLKMAENGSSPEAPDRFVTGDNGEPERPSPDQDPKTGRFLPGNSGNGGRPKGARSKLNAAFLGDMYSEWQEHGREAVARVREEKPEVFLRVVASILPKDMKIEMDDSFTGFLERVSANTWRAYDKTPGI